MTNTNEESPIIPEWEAMGIPVIDDEEPEDANVAHSLEEGDPV